MNSFCPAYMECIKQLEWWDVEQASLFGNESKQSVRDRANRAAFPIPSRRVGRGHKIVVHRDSYLEDLFATKEEDN